MDKTRSKYTWQRSKLIKANTRILLAKKENKEAIRILKILNEKYKDDYEIDLHLGKAYYLDRQYEEAITVYKRMMSENHMVEEAASNIITILQESNRSNEARIYADNLEESLKRNIDVKRAIAFLKLGLEEFHEASLEYAKLCLDEPQQPLNWLNYSASEKALKNSYKALRIIKSGIILHPKHKKLKYTMQCLAEIGKLEASASILRGNKEY